MIDSKFYPVDEVLPHVRTGRVCLDGDWVRVGRFAVFKDKGIKCVACGLQAQFFRKEKMANEVNWHLNLYGVGPDNKVVLFTRDHIMPRALGGKSKPTNLQPMCVRCNNLKGDRLRTQDRWKVTWFEVKRFVGIVRKIWRV